MGGGGSTALPQEEDTESQNELKPTSNWRLCTTLEEKFHHLYLSSLFCDIEFNVIGDNGAHIFKANSTILGIASPVFERMFFNENFDKTNKIIITDIECKFFESFLKFLYKIKIDLTSMEEAWSLYYLGEKYIIPELKGLCKPYILKSLEPKTACTTYEMSKMYNLKDLIDKSFELIIDETHKVVNAPSFIRATKETIFTILDQKKLNIREADLLVGVVNWATHQGSDSRNEEIDGIKSNQVCNFKNTQKCVQEKKRCNLIKYILSNIYFMDISADEFACKVRGMDILTIDESLSIIMTLVSKEAPLWPHEFKTCARKNKDK